MSYDLTRKNLLDRKAICEMLQERDAIEPLFSHR